MFRSANASRVRGNGGNLRQRNNVKIATKHCTDQALVIRLVVTICFDIFMSKKKRTQIANTETGQ